MDRDDWAAIRALQRDVHFQGLLTQRQIARRGFLRASGFGREVEIKGCFCLWGTTLKSFPRKGTDWAPTTVWGDGLAAPAHCFCESSQPRERQKRKHAQGGQGSCPRSPHSGVAQEEFRFGMFLLCAFHPTRSQTCQAYS